MRRANGLNEDTNFYPLNLFVGKGSEVGLSRSGTDYWLYQYISPQLYFATGLLYQDSLGYLLNQIKDLYVVYPVTNIGFTDASIVYAGTWANVGYMRSLTPGSTVTWTTPANTYKVGLTSYAYTSVGVALVEIDGSTANADLLPTAQDSVNAGRLPASILVANGGTLNPTDHIWDGYYVASIATRQMFSSLLSPGVHTVKMTVTGYKQTGSTSVYIRITNFLYTTTNTNLSTANSTILVTDLVPTESVWEYVFYLKPAGATLNNVFIGNGHGYDRQTSISFKVDQVSVVPADGSFYSGQRIDVTRASNLFHPDLGATSIASVNLVYTMLPNTGLWVDYSITWATAGISGASCYPAMGVTGPIFDRGTGLLTKNVYDLSVNSGQFRPSIKDNLLYMWDSDGIYGFLMWIPDIIEATNNYPANWYFAIEDRSNGTLNKCYLIARNSETWSVGDIWSCNTNYRWQVFTDADILMKGTLI